MTQEARHSSASGSILCLYEIFVNLKILMYKKLNTQHNWLGILLWHRRLGIPVPGEAAFFAYMCNELTI